MLQLLWLHSIVSKRNLQDILNGRILSNIADGDLVVNGLVSSGIYYMRKSSSDLTFCMNHLFLVIMHRMTKSVPNMIFACFIKHGYCAGNMESKIIFTIDGITFGDAPEGLISAMNRGSFGW